MTRRLKPKTFTLRPDQINYLNDRCKNTPHEKSRWIREAVDARIKIELYEAKKIVKRALAKARGGESLDTETKLGVIDAAQRETLHNFRTTVEQELAESLINPDGHVSSKASQQPEVRSDIRDTERSE